MAELTDEKRSTGGSLDILSALLSHPEMLSKMGEVIARHTNAESIDIREDGPHGADDRGINAAKSALNEGSSPTYSDGKDGGSPELSAILPSLLGALGKGGIKICENKEQTALLLAIRPYLSPHRKELVDTFLKVNKLGEILKNLA